MNAKQEYELNITNITIKYKVKGCTCEYPWRSIRPGHHNDMIGYLVGYTTNNELIISVGPTTSWCQTTSWEQIQNAPTLTNPILDLNVVDRYNYDGPDSKLLS